MSQWSDEDEPDVIGPVFLAAIVIVVLVCSAVRLFGGLR